MKTRVIEVSSGLVDGNWGRFLLQQYESSERTYESRYSVPGEPPTLLWKEPPPDTALWILDLVTQEGACFDVAQPLLPQLERHQVWTCVLYEPFLAWLFEYCQTHTPFRLDDLPPNLHLTAPQELIGYRHGPWLEQLPHEARQFLAHPAVHQSLPLSLKKLLKKLLPNTSTR